MVIKRQRVTATSALLEVEADSTDTVDAFGTSDIINTVTAKTAKFSDTSVMQANAALRLGVLQLQINTGTKALNSSRTRDVIRNNVSLNDVPNAIDSDLDTKATSSFADIFPFEIIVIDFGTSATTSILAKVEHRGSNPGTTLEVSEDDIDWDVVSTITSTGIQTHNGGVQTYQFARLRQIEPLSSGFADVFEIFDQDPATGEVTVNIRSSATQDGTDGTILTTEAILPESSLLLDTELFLTGNGEFFTLEITAFAEGEFDVSLSDITSIREE